MEAPVPSAPVPAAPVYPTCPECGAAFWEPSSLTDHVLTAHVAAETPAASIRRTRLDTVGGGILAGIGIIGGLVVWGLFIVGMAGSFDKETVAESPDSVVHKVAVGLVVENAIEDYRAVEPDDGWDVEYQLDLDTDQPDFGLPDGEIRIRDERTALEELEFEAVNDELYDDILDELRERGFRGFEPFTP